MKNAITFLKIVKKERMYSTKGVMTFIDATVNLMIGDKHLLGKSVLTLMYGRYCGGNVPMVIETIQAVDCNVDVHTLHMYDIDELINKLESKLV